MEAGKALLVLGMTRAALDPAASEPLAAPRQLLEAVAGEIAYFRQRGRPVIFLVSGAAGATPASLQEQLHPALPVDPLEPLLPLPTISACCRTGRGPLLEQGSVDTVTLVGLRAHVEILFSAAEAVTRGLRITVPAPCIASACSEDHEIALRLIRRELMGARRVEG